MNTPEDKDKPPEGIAIPKDRNSVAGALRDISKENEDLKPGDVREEGPGQAPEGAGADAPVTTTHSGQTARGSYSTDSSTGAGRYQDHTTGTFGTDPLDEQTDEAIDPKID